MSRTCDDIVQDEGGPRVERPFDPSTRELFCAACPKYARRTETCPILGIRRVPSARMCRYGETVEGEDKMNDTHGQSGRGWYGFDLDGTLAVYDGWRGIGHIGAPVAPMVALIRRMYFTAPGLRVKILTARVAPRSNIETLPNPYLENHWCIEEPDERPWTMKPTWTALEFIQDWCWAHLGFVPEITHEKDHLMLNLFDDRVVQVEPNTGKIIGRMPPELAKYGEDR